MKLICTIPISSRSAYTVPNTEEANHYLHSQLDPQQRKWHEGMLAFKRPSLNGSKQEINEANNRQRQKQDRNKFGPRARAVKPHSHLICCLGCNVGSACAESQHRYADSHPPWSVSVSATWHGTHLQSHTSLGSCMYQFGGGRMPASQSCFNCAFTTSLPKYLRGPTPVTKDLRTYH